jgi:hypothetical protein
VKIAFSFLVSLCALSFTQSAHANTIYKGKCAKQAENAAVQKWADVPDPSPTLEYITVSSQVKEPRGDTYEVVLALGDGNETGYAKYEVVFGELSNCSRAKVSVAK